METTQIERQLIDYFKEKMSTTVDAQTALLDEKVIDSMGVIELITFIEAAYHVEMTDDDLTVENFKDIEAIINLILNKNGRQRQ